MTEDWQETEAVSKGAVGHDVDAHMVALDDEETFLVTGDLGVFDGYDVLPLAYLTETQRQHLADSIAVTSGIANTAVQVANGLQQAAGIVRLAPETMALLRAGAAPLASGGWNIGALQSGGKIVAQLRWAPAGAAGGVAALAAIGPALALAAVQWQLTSISKSVERNIALTQSILDELRTERWHELKAAVQLVLDETRAAIAIGGVTDHLWEYLHTQSSLATLQKHLARHMESLVRAEQTLKTTGRPREWLQGEYQDLVRDAQSVLAAQQAITLHQTLRAAHARRTGKPEDDALAQHVLQRARREHAHCAALLNGVLRSVHRELGMRWDAERSRQELIAGKKVPLSDVLDAIEDLQHRAAAGPFRQQLTAIIDPPRIQAGNCLALSDRDRVVFISRLRWLLDEGEALFLLAAGEFTWGPGPKRRLLVVTTLRLLFIDAGELRDGRAVYTEVPAGVDFRPGEQREAHEQIDIELNGVRGKIIVRHDSADNVYASLQALSQRHDTT